MLHCCTRNCIRVVINLNLQRDDYTILLVLKCLPCGYNQSLNALTQEMSNESFGKTNINKSLDCSVTNNVVLAKFKFGDFVTIRQFIKFSSLPKFVFIWYTHSNPNRLIDCWAKLSMNLLFICMLWLWLITYS